MLLILLCPLYIGSNSRTERPRKTKIGTHVADVTHDSDTTVKVKRSNVKVTRPVYSPRRLHTCSCSGQRGIVLSVGTAATLPSAGAALAQRQAPTWGGEGRGISCRHVHSFLIILIIINAMNCQTCCTVNINICQVLICLHLI